MKKCPYCAEEIQEAARICRYCHKRVKISYARYIIIALLILAMGGYIFTHQREIGKVGQNVNSFFNDLGEIWRLFRKALKNMSDGTTATDIKDYKSYVKTINELSASLKKDKVEKVSVNGNP